jgi:hypothetical protein
MSSGSWSDGEMSVRISARCFACKVSGIVLNPNTKMYAKYFEDIFICLKVLKKKCIQLNAEVK